MEDFYLIGLTGNLGSGKSTVRRMLEQKGAFGIDADKLAHVAMERGSQPWGAIVAVFGADVLKFNGDIDRRKLAARVFNDTGALKKLEVILHPTVGALVRDILRHIDSPVVALEAIKLIEAGMHTWCDALWVVTCNPETAAARVMRERHMTLEEARARLAAQSSPAEKTKIANVVIDNSGDEETTLAQVQAAWEKTVRPNKGRPKTALLYSLPRPAKKAGPPESSSAKKPASRAPSPLREAGAIPQPPEPPPPERAPETSAPRAPEAATAPNSAQLPTNAPKESKPAQTASPSDASVPVEVRRARRSDLFALAVALGKREKRLEPLGRDEVIERFGARGYWVAVNKDQIIALVAWEAENLVATLREMWAESDEQASRAFPPLLTLIEQEARTLQCEVSAMLLDVQAQPFVATQAQNLGYQPSELVNLHRVWRPIVEARLQPGDQLLVKRLREDIVIRPV